MTLLRRTNTETGGWCAGSATDECKRFSRYKVNDVHYCEQHVEHGLVWALRNAYERGLRDRERVA